MIIGDLKMSSSGSSIDFSRYDNPNTKSELVLGSIKLKSADGNYAVMNFDNGKINTLTFANDGSEIAVEQEIKGDLKVLDNLTIDKDFFVNRNQIIEGNLLINGGTSIKGKSICERKC